MGVLDEAIREHLDLKRRRGASEDEIARAEAEALGPPRRSPAPFEDEALLDDDHDSPLDEDDEPIVDDAAATRMMRQPPEVSPSRPEPAVPTRAVHDIDEDPLAPPPPVARPGGRDDEDEDGEPELEEPDEGKTVVQPIPEPPAATPRAPEPSGATPRAPEPSGGDARPAEPPATDEPTEPAHSALREHLDQPLRWLREHRGGGRDDS